MTQLQQIKTILFLFLVFTGINQGFTQSEESTDSSLHRMEIKSVEDVTDRKNMIRQIDRSQQANLFNSFTAKIAGVTVRSNSGSPGASTTIRIRGNRSILNDNNPLIIVDGMPIDNSIGSNSIGQVDQSNRAIDLNAYDIESIEFVKNMYANVIYGIRGANGALIITTKKAKKNDQMKINLRYGFTISQVNNLPDYQTTYSQGRSTGGSLIHRGPETSENYSWGPAIADFEYDDSGRLVPTGTGTGNEAIAYDNLDNFFVNGPMHTINTSISGASNNLTYHFSAGLLDQKGTVPNSDFYRKSVRLALGYELLKNLDATISINYVNSGSNNRIQTGSNFSGVPLGLFRTPPSFDNGNGKKGREAAEDPETYQFVDGTQRKFGTYDNPYWSINKNPNNTDVDRLIGNLNLNYELNENLSLMYQIGYDQWKEDGLSGIDVYSALRPDGAVELFTAENRHFNTDLTLNYSKSLSRLFRLEGMLGYNYFYSSAYQQQLIGYGFTLPGIFTLSNTQDDSRIVKETNQKIAGVYAGIDLLFANQLSLGILARNDWASVLPVSQNSSTYYGAEIVWDAASAFKSKDVFGLSIFSSWGKAGNRPGAYLTSTYYSPGNVVGSSLISDIQFPEFGVEGYEPNAVRGAADLAPEITKGIELGFDAQLIVPEIGLSYTYYHNTSSNVILNVPVSRNSGFNELYMNTAEISNYGHEISFFAAPIKKQLRWDFLVNLYLFENMVTSLAANVDRVRLSGFVSTGSYAIADQPYGAIYGSSFRRTDDGQLIIDDNGWPLQASEDQVIGDPNPEWTLGIQNSFSFKGLSLSFLLDVRHGGDMWNGTTGIMNTFGTSSLTADQRNIRGFVFEGVKEDDNSVTNTTAVDFYNPRYPVSQNRWNRYAFGGLSVENIQNTSWVRLREITLTYQLPANLLTKVGIQSSSISLIGRNLWLITEYKGIDPEANLFEGENGFGLDYFNLPNVKSYGVVLNFNF